MSTTLKLTTLLLFALPLVACGGGGGGGGDDVAGPQTVVLTIDRDRSARMFDGGQLLRMSTSPAVGAYIGYAPTFEYRGVLSWALPEGITSDRVESAVIRVNQKQVSAGTYTALGAMLWSVIDIGADIDQADWDSLPLVRPLAAFIPDESLGLKEIVTTGIIKSHLDANRDEFSIRLYFGPAGTSEQYLSQLDLNDSVDYELVLTILP